MNDKIAWRLLWTVAVAVIVLFAVQYLFDRKVQPESLIYVVPICTASYVIGRYDGSRAHVSGRQPDELNK
jgi:hypothetical protein